MIFKKRLHNKFTAISNAVCTDTSISTDARWCLWYLLTKPADWEVRIKDVRQVSGWGRDKAYKVVNELVEAKYLVVSQPRTDGGQFDAISYDVYEEPVTGLPFPEKPDAVKPDSENKEHTKDLKVPNTEKVLNTQNNTSNSEFEEFWAAYPKRPNNPRKKAMAAYAKARKNVSQKQLLTAVGEYAAYMAGENPKFIAMASTWLNDERWNCDYTKSVEVIQAYKETKYGSDAELDKLADEFPGHVGDRDRAKKFLAEELSKGATLEELCEAARKYKLFCKGPPYENRKIAPAMLEQWLKFKWREMDGYEFCAVGPDRIKTVRPKKEVK